MKHKSPFDPEGEGTVWLVGSFFGFLFYHKLCSLILTVACGAFTESH